MLRKHSFQRLSELQGIKRSIWNTWSLAAELQGSLGGPMGCRLCYELCYGHLDWGHGFGIRFEVTWHLFLCNIVHLLTKSARICSDSTTLHVFLVKVSSRNTSESWHRAMLKCIWTRLPLCCAFDERASQSHRRLFRDQQSTRLGDAGNVALQRHVQWRSRNCWRRFGGSGMGLGRLWEGSKTGEVSPVTLAVGDITWAYFLRVQCWPFQIWEGGQIIEQSPFPPSY